MELSGFNVDKVWNEHCNFTISDVLKNPIDREIYISSLILAKKKLLGMLNFDDALPEEQKYKHILLKLDIAIRGRPADVTARRMIEEIEEMLFILEPNPSSNAEVSGIIFIHVKPEEFAKELCKKLKKEGFIQEDWKACKSHFENLSLFENKIFWMDKGPTSLFYLFHKLNKKKIVAPTMFENLLGLLFAHFDCQFKPRIKSDNDEKYNRNKYASWKTTHNRLLKNELKGEKNTKIDNVLEKLQIII